MRMLMRTVVEEFVAEQPATEDPVEDAQDAHRNVTAETTSGMDGSRSS